MTIAPTRATVPGERILADVLVVPCPPAPPLPRSPFGVSVDHHLRAERRRVKHDLFAYVYGMSATRASAAWAGAIINRAGEVGAARAYAEAPPLPAGAPEWSPSRQYMAIGLSWSDAYAKGIDKARAEGAAAHALIEAATRDGLVAEADGWPVRLVDARVVDHVYRGVNDLGADSMHYNKRIEEP